MWSLAQMVKSVATSTFAGGALWAAADEWEASAWEGWERLLGTSSTEQPDIDVRVLDVPTIDLRSCNEGACSGPNSSRSKLTVSEVKALAGDDFLSKPLLLRGLWNEKELADPKRRLSIRGMQHHAELANLSVPFYAAATKSGYAALKPNGHAPLSEIVHNITELKGSQKIGSQLVVETYPTVGHLDSTYSQLQPLCLSSWLVRRLLVDQMQMLHKQAEPIYIVSLLGMLLCSYMGQKCGLWSIQSKVHC